MRRRLVDAVWESGSVGARLARGALVPAGWAFGAGVALRNLAYDRGWLASHDLGLAAIAVGNLTVGGTGKTPVTAWVAARLRQRGASPAILLRGYGGDEVAVHEVLNPGVPVVAGADRARGAVQARARGANVLVLDDGFQHRRVHRDADIVLLSADRFGPVRLLPAGPWREPLTALARASLVLVTRKRASPVRARELLAQALRFAPGTPGGVVELAPDALVALSGGATRAVATLAGEAILAVSGIGDARAFEAQLRALGARVDGEAFGDHHAYTAADVRDLAARARGASSVVCTLKDAAKLAPIWPREAPAVWYLSQRVSVEAGAESLEALIAGVAARTAP